MFNKSTNREIAKGMFLYISYSVLMPLLLVGGVGYFLSKILNNNFVLLFSVFIAYLISNILMFKKLKKINQGIEKSADILPDSPVGDSDFCKK